MTRLERVAERIESSNLSRPTKTMGAWWKGLHSGLKTHPFRGSQFESGCAYQNFARLAQSGRGGGFKIHTV